MGKDKHYIWNTVGIRSTSQLAHG